MTQVRSAHGSPPGRAAMPKAGTGYSCTGPYCAAVSFPVRSPERVRSAHHPKRRPGCVGPQTSPSVPRLRGTARNHGLRATMGSCPPQAAARRGAVAEVERSGPAHRGRGRPQRRLPMHRGTSIAQHDGREPQRAPPPREAQPLLASRPTRRTAGRFRVPGGCPRVRSAAARSSPKAPRRLQGLFRHAARSIFALASAAYETRRARGPAAREAQSRPPARPATAESTNEARRRVPGVLVRMEPVRLISTRGPDMKAASPRAPAERFAVGEAPRGMTTLAGPEAVADDPGSQGDRLGPARCLSRTDPNRKRDCRARRPAAITCNTCDAMRAAAPLWRLQKAVAFRARQCYLRRKAMLPSALSSASRKSCSIPNRCHTEHEFRSVLARPLRLPSTDGWLQCP